MNRLQDLKPEKSAPSRRRFRPILEALEDRLAPAAFSVLNTNDTGPGSLHQAILNANATPGADTIDFNIGGGGVQTISPGFQLANITGPVTIDGTTQPGYAGTPVIELSGADAGFGANGLVILSGNSTVRGLAINGYRGPQGLAAPVHQNVTGTAIVLYQGGGNVIEGNFIGTDVTGKVPRPNTGDGITILDSSGNRIGGTAPGAGNVIAGNGRMGVYVQRGSNNVIAGNKIGTNVMGAADLGNGLHGVLVRADFSGSSSNNQVGGTAPGARNIISGNGGFGVGFHQSTGAGNVVLGNYIGTDVTGTMDLGNDQGGVNLSAEGGHSTVGGTAAGAGNVISGNGASGVNIGASQHHQVLGNLIGTDATGTKALGNSGAGVAFALQFFADSNTVGGPAPGARNVISANGGDGVLFHSARFNVIQGNYIGTDITGSKALGNGGWGVHIAFGPPHGQNFNTGLNLIGTNGNGVNDAAEGNVIAGNALGGVIIRAETTLNVVAGNRIGTDAAGMVILGNGNGPGVWIRENAPANRIGMDGNGLSDAVEGNVIAGHKAGGVVVEGAGSTGNLIRGNSIYANTGLGIDLGNNGVTPNDAGDGDTGPENLQNYPVLSSVRGGATTRVIGTLNSRPSTTYTLDFYASPTADPSGFGEGKRHLGSVLVTTDAAGNASFAATLPDATAQSELVTATASDPSGNTSEFSQVRVVIPAVAINDVSVVEGDNGTASATFTVSLSTPSSQTVTVDFATANDTATGADGDYQVTSGTVTFAPGQTSATIVVWVNGDQQYETDETFVVNLSNPTNAGRADSQGTGTITNDDSQPTVSISDASQPEGDAGAAGLTFTVSLSNGSYQSITVSFSTADGTATGADNDYQGTGGTLTFAPGETSQTVTVQVHGDMKLEADETFHVNLADAGNATVADGQGTGTVENDDAPGAILKPDPCPCDPSKTTLVVNATSGDDTIVFSPVGSGGAVRVTLNGTSLGTFHPTGRIIAFGHAGNDDVQVAGGIDLPAWLYGGTGNDRLKGGAGNNVLLGGDGDDHLIGGGGRNLLIGGQGSDRLVGNSGDDILIGGTTSYDGHDAALCRIMDEWSAARAHATRVANLRAGSGYAAGYVLDNSSILDDGEDDRLTGSAGIDWFFAGLGDILTDRKAGEPIG